MLFKAENGSLRSHAIVNGRTDCGKVDSVATLTGSAFQVDGDIQPFVGRYVLKIFGDLIVGRELALHLEL